ncbi:MAG: hypothetical protein MK160_16495 [Rhodobacteraceae bacterium]|nr:hypothetical protein [Paracoccaceae bacterium]
MKRLTRYFVHQDGAVTTDWVVLTGALIGLAIALVAVFGDKTQNVGDLVATMLSGLGIGAGVSF